MLYFDRTTVFLGQAICNQSLLVHELLRDQIKGENIYSQVMMTCGTGTSVINTLGVLILGTTGMVTSGILTLGTLTTGTETDGMSMLITLLLLLNGNTDNVSLMS